MGAAQRVELAAKRIRAPSVVRQQQQRAIQQQLQESQQRAARALGVSGPSQAIALHVRGRWPSGAPIELDVLALGELHQPHAPRRGFLQVRELLQVAAERARARGACVDAFIEHSFDRCVGRLESDSRYRRDRSRPRQVVGYHPDTIAAIAWSLAGAVAPPHAVARTMPPHQKIANPLGSTGARVHWFDPRPTCHQGALYYGQPDILISDRATRERWMRALMGLDDHNRLTRDALPHDLVAQLEAILGSVDAAEWMREHFVRLARVHKRARKLDPEDLEYLARKVVGTQHEPMLADILATAADFYLLLRMLVGYPEGPACAAGPPRHCLVYAGEFHTEHVIEILQSICEDFAAVATRPATQPWRGAGQAIWQQTHIEVPIETLLERMGLGRGRHPDASSSAGREGKARRVR